MTIFKLIINRIAKIAHYFAPGVRLIFGANRLTMTGRFQCIALQPLNGYVHGATARIARIVGDVVDHFVLADVQKSGIQIPHHRQFSVRIIVDDRIFPFDEALVGVDAVRTADGNEKFGWIEAIVHHWRCIVHYGDGEVTFGLVLERIDGNV